MTHDYCIAICQDGSYLEEPDPNADTYVYQGCDHLYDGLAVNYAERWDSAHEEDDYDD